MKLGIVSPASKEFEPLAKLTRANKLEYQYEWGFDCHFPVYPPGNDHGWFRIKCMAEFLPRYDWLLFIGADTLFTNIKTDVRQYCYEDADLVAAWDTMGLQSDVLFLRNCEIVNRFLQDILGREDEDSKRQGFMDSSDQGCMVRLLSGRSIYFDDNHAFEKQVTPSSECQAYGLRVKEAPKSINRYLDDYQLGDPIFHTPGMPLHEKIRHMEIMLKQVIR